MRKGLDSTKMAATCKVRVKLAPRFGKYLSLCVSLVDLAFKQMLLQTVKNGI